MSNEEIVVPYVIDDFEPGDSVYRTNLLDKQIALGKVVSVTEDHVNIILDHRNYSIEISRFGFNKHPVYEWEKMMINIEDLEEGVRLSQLMPNGSRLWGTLVEFRMPRSYRVGIITFCMDADPDNKVSFRPNNTVELEKLMSRWEIEE